MPFWRRTWFIVTAGLVVIFLLVGALSGDPQTPRDRAVTTGAPSTDTPTPTTTPSPTPDPLDAARAKAAELAADGRYGDAVPVLEAAGLRRAADRVARSGSLALARRARQALAAGQWARARRIAAGARHLHRSPSVNAIIATAVTRIAAAREAARLARDQRTCTAGEKATVRAGGAAPAGCTAFAAEFAAQAAAQAAAAATPDCNPNYAGACLKPDSPDYDCAGGSGNGPDYTGTVRVVGDDEYDLDADGDGVGCDS